MSLEPCGREPAAAVFLEPVVGLAGRNLLHRDEEVRLRTGRACVVTGDVRGHGVVGIDPHDSDLICLCSAAVAARWVGQRHRGGGDHADYRCRKRQRKNALLVHSFLLDFSPARP